MNLQAYAPLEALLLENDFYLAYSLVSMLRDESQDATASALVSVFVQPNSTTFQRIIGRIIDFEVTRCGGHEALVFRDSMSPAAKFLDVLLERYASKFMLKALSSIRKRILKVANQLEVNPAKADPEAIAHNVSIVTQLAFDVLTNVFSSAKKFPLPIAHIIALLAERLSQFASSDAAARTAVGTIVMLKLVGPLLCSTQNGILSTMSPRKVKSIDNAAVTKGLVTIAKILQSIANGASYEPENYMSCFNEFIKNNEPVYIEFMQNLLKLTAKSSKKIVDDLPPRKLLKEWSKLYSYLNHNQERVRDKCLALDDMSTSKGGVEGLSGAELADQFTHAFKLVAAEKEKAELDNLQVFM